MATSPKASRSDQKKQISARNTYLLHAAESLWSLGEALHKSPGNKLVVEHAGQEREFTKADLKQAWKLWKRATNNTPAYVDKVYNNRVKRARNFEEQSSGDKPLWGGDLVKAFLDVDSKAFGLFDPADRSKGYLLDRLPLARAGVITRNQFEALVHRYINVNGLHVRDHGQFVTPDAHFRATFGRIAAPHGPEKSDNPQQKSGLTFMKEVYSSWKSSYDEDGKRRVVQGADDTYGVLKSGLTILMKEKKPVLDMQGRRVVVRKTAKKSEEPVRVGTEEDGSLYEGVDLSDPVSVASAFSSMSACPYFENAIRLYYIKILLSLYLQPVPDKMKGEVESHKEELVKEAMAVFESGQLWKARAKEEKAKSKAK